jgi:hypothetical protein
METPLQADLQPDVKQPQPHADSPVLVAVSYTHLRAHET